MGLRVRKLAKELKRSPDEILGFLRELGYSRYRTSEDMLADVVVEKLRLKMPRGGYSPPPVSLKKTTTSGAALMATLVPGVTPLAGTKSAISRPKPPAPKQPRKNIQSEPVVDTSKVKVSADLEALRLSLEGQRSSLKSELALLDAERLALEEEKKNFQKSIEGKTIKAQVAESGTSLMDVLTSRGLRGVDEFERTIESLAKERLLRDVLGELEVRNVDKVSSFLNEKLMLMGGDPLPFLERSVAMVAVSDDRSEIDGAYEIRRSLEALGEGLMLNGIRDVLLVDERSIVCRCAQEYLDGRVQLRISSRLGEREVSEMSGTRVLLLWGATYPEQMKASLEATTFKYYLDGKQRSIREHCVRTRSWLSE